ncbi:MAG: PAS domain S-box protein [Rhodoferax sp.]|nr:PAS domain S-box protein [Rhodoferax sp.]
MGRGPPPGSRPGPGRPPLRDRARRYHALVKASLDAILLTVPDGRILAANPAACRMFGRSEEEIQRIGRMGVVDSADPRLNLALEQRRRTGQFVGELTLLRQNGERFVGEVSTSNFDGANGQPQSSMIIRDATERLRAQAALRDHAQQLQALSARVLAAQEAERRRVAMELHDELGQALTAIKINLQLQDRSEPGATLTAENLRIVDDALQQVRRIAMALRPALLDDLGLVPALRWLGEQAAARSGFVFHFQCEPAPERLAGEIETACFRIVQEALTNVARYAQAKQVQVEVQVEVQHDGASHLLLCVQDDGVGFDPIARQAGAHVGDGMGLLGMQERAALIGGALQIESAPGQGCLLRLRCPLRLPEVAP